MHLAAALLQVVLWHAYRAGEEQAINQAVAEYNALARPRGVEVRAVPVPFDAYNQKRASAIPHGNGPDLFIASHDGLGEWRRDGLVAPMRLSPKAPDFMYGLVAALSDDGKTWGLPLAWKSLALYYRTDQLSTPPRTTDELFAAVQGHYALAYETGSFYYHAIWLHAFGGLAIEARIDGSSSSTIRPRLATREGERAIAWVRAQAERGRLPGDASSTTATQLFRDGQAASLVSGPWLLGELPASLPYAVAPLPILSETGQAARPYLTVEGIFLSARAQHAEEAERFATWLAGPGAITRAVAGRQLVAWRAAWEDPRLRGDTVLAGFRAQLESTISLPTDPVMGAIWEPAQEALRKALRGDLSPHDALVGADRRITLALAPPPPAADPRPYLGVLALVVVLLGVWLARRKPSEERGGGLAPWGYLSPAMICLVTLVFVPFALGAAMSLFHHVPGPNGGRFVFVGLDNFTRLLGSTEQPIWDPLSFYFTLLVTILWTAVNIALHVTIGVGLALLLRNPLLRLRGMYRVLLIVPWAMPSYITALVWKGMFHRQLGAINALLGLLGIAPVAWFAHFWTSFAANVATNVWLGFPFMMVVTLGALARIPSEVEEAAILDGATSWQRLRHVILPLLRPALMPSVVLGAVWTFNMFNVVFLVSGGEPDGGTELLISQAYRWAFSPGRGQRYGYAAAYAVVIFLLLWAQSRLSRRLTETEA